MTTPKSPLPKSLKGRPFRYHEAISAGLTRHQLHILILEGILEQRTRGIYAETQVELDDDQAFTSAMLRVGNPSAICLLSALSYYGLTDEIPNKTWIMVPFEKRSRYPDLKLFRTRNPHWDIGIEQQSGFRITSLDRTLVDSLANKSKLGSVIGIQALKTGLNQRKTKIRNIAELARQLGVFHRIKTIVEAIG